MTTIGTCSECGGPVQVSDVPSWMEGIMCYPVCAQCGAKSVHRHGPLIPMEPKQPNEDSLPTLNDINAFWKARPLRDVLSVPKQPAIFPTGGPEACDKILKAYERILEAMNLPKVEGVPVDACNVAPSQTAGEHYAEFQSKLARDRLLGSDAKAALPW